MQSSTIEDEIERGREREREKYVNGRRERGPSSKDLGDSIEIYSDRKIEGLRVRRKGEEERERERQRDREKREYRET